VKTKEKWDLTKLDVLSLFDAIGVNYATSGKNVTEGWVNINCSFCFDHGNHLGVNLTSKNFSCWICRESGGIFKLVQKLTGFSNSAVGRLINEHIKDSYQSYYVPETRRKFQVELPTRCLDNPKKIHREYLESRNFNHKELERNFGIKYTSQISSFLRSDGKRSNFSYRIIIPIMMNGKLVNFTARDVTGRADNKYKNCPNDDVVFHTKDCIYGFDLAGKGTFLDMAVFVEGPTDVWRIGPGAFGLFGLKYTENQIRAIYQKELKKAYILFDNEPKAQEIAGVFAKEIGAFIPEVFVIEPEGFSDPGSMNKKQLRELKQIMGF